ncbi:MAG: hypothetical protein WBO55_02355 [Rhizobiaceae bacterium]
MLIEILDHISDPGNACKANDDALGHSAHHAVVIDGATGLADTVLLEDEPSDAAWLAGLAASVFSRGDGMPAGGLVGTVARTARETLAQMHDLDHMPRHALPVASFIMVRRVGQVLELSGLGDCVAYVRTSGGESVRHCALKDNRMLELRNARAALDASGGFDASGSVVRDPGGLEKLRAARSRANDGKGGIWLLGLEAEAANHALNVSVRHAGEMEILLMSDGFSALSEAYERYSQDGLVDAALRSGLKYLLDELRDIEHRIDPLGRVYPRYKRSDDATAILARITPGA